MSINQYFSDSYVVSRLKFRGLLGAVQQRWPEAELKTVAVCPDKEFTTDMIIAQPREKRHVLMVTTGQHGIEGYAGGAFLQLLAREYLDKLDPELTGLVLVHAINPWGMANYRRVDQDNIDLNRNFITDWSEFKDINKDYSRLRFLLEPGELGKKREKAAFYFRVARALALAGSGGIKRALTLGQYRFDKGLYFGGSEHQPVARWLIDLYHGVLRDFKQVVHLDIHTGYGPARRMTIVNSALDPRDTAGLKEQLGYDLIVKADPQEFYSIQGDMVDYNCWLGRQYPEAQLYSTCFEFGTLGDSIGALLQSMRALIDENRLWQHRGGDTLRDEAIRKQFVEAFYPNCSMWRQRAVEDARRALTGILGNEGLITSN
jgi:predicted deacylase